MTTMNSFPSSWLNDAQNNSSLPSNATSRIQIAEALSRRTEYFHDWMKSANGRQNTRCCRIEYSYGRQSTCYDCGNTLTSDKVSDAKGWSTHTADRVLTTTAEILRRLTEQFRNLRKHQDSRQSTRHYGIEYSNGRQSTSYNGRSTLTAVVVQIPALISERNCWMP